MERWDFDCQRCKKGIYHYSAIKNEDIWYECPSGYNGNHEISGVGPRGGYSFCATCAKENNYVCPVCKAVLKEKGW